MEAQTYTNRPQSPRDVSTASGSVPMRELPKNDGAKCASPTNGPPTDKWVTIHLVYCSGTHQDHQGHHSCAYFLDLPALPTGASPTTPLRGRDRLLDIGSYLPGRDGFDFVIYLEYDCEAHDELTKDTSTSFPKPCILQDEGIELKNLPAEPISERLHLSESLEEALRALYDQDTNKHQEWDFAEDVTYPYTKLYNCRCLFIDPMIQLLEPQQQLELERLFHYLAGRLNVDYQRLAELSAAGVISQKYWPLLFRPNDTVITIKNDQYEAFVITSCRLINQTTLNMECWTWEYNGNFFRKHFTVTSEWPSSSKQVPITQLSAYPVRYAVDGVEYKLRERGCTFWGCRRRKYVNYNVQSKGLRPQLTNLRYMVDMDTYRSTHSAGDYTLKEGEFPDDVLESDEIPQGSLALLLPSTIIGYGFHNRKWDKLLVDHIRDIEWNSGVFGHQLVLTEAKKELIKALVTVHIDDSRTTKADFMDGKGEGLLILLHGGPGTGKTLTAESIAELVKRPLFRLSCGDLGTDAQSVEKNLISALAFGSHWDCIGLLDEAEVFVEERASNSFQRNALLSVFLRILETYDGILILTTNCVGVFDEAMTSRIQLALHYPPLDTDSRWRIWKNLVQSISETGENINEEDITTNLDSIARYKLNGRAIRNTLTTARQLARYKKEALNHAHINQALGVVNEFLEYIMRTKEGLNEIDFAFRRGWREDSSFIE
ncbi:P-loop containing nucleoside triphosphate hydrolase protein [Alternaria rosae]|uniref:P-loop containing nucleoside triphosphate hydrolase protein n=1 Tax=Alternaria rosae TaxID=1187941 RepID=UPI001E8D59CB|nr:P-loop containing nucleoside triphosphate hydrolase protein [Alternaria rosae]KAH6875244.1 P-loop containing nucleoside triphosphate hydrolase protein [Alternaria rosae]